MMLAGWINEKERSWVVNLSFYLSDGRFDPIGAPTVPEIDK